MLNFHGKLEDVKAFLNTDGYYPRKTGRSLEKHAIKLEEGHCGKVKTWFSKIGPVELERTDHHITVS